MDELDAQAAASHADEIRRRERFGFGRNWSSYSTRIGPPAIDEARRSLLKLLPVEVLPEQRLDGQSLLDAGCGSGLFSVAALQLGAQVTSFDFDPDSVRTTRRVVEFHASDPVERGMFRLQHGSVLDEGFLDGLGQFDVVYSWGVLHHTGSMWEACRLLAERVRPGGILVIALYNDVGTSNHVWHAIKRVYVGAPRLLRMFVAGVILLPIEAVALVRSLVRGSLRSYVRRWTDYGSMRGMSRWHDHLDWIGGLPYEWAAPSEVVGFFTGAGFRHVLTHPAVAWGNNEFTFVRDAADDSDGERRSSG